MYPVMLAGVVLLLLAAISHSASCEQVAATIQITVLGVGIVQHDVISVLICTMGAFMIVISIFSAQVANCDIMK
jgi:hypothetical protein